MVYGGSGCEALPDLTNQIVLLTASTSCSVEDMATNAQNANALAAVIAVQQDQQLYEVCCIVLCCVVLCCVAFYVCFAALLTD